MGIFSDKDKGFKDLMTVFKINAGESSGFAGFLRSSGEYKGKSEREHMSVAQNARIQEYGSTDGRIPERAPIRHALDNNGKELRSMTKKLAQKVLDKKLGREEAIGLICQKVVDWIKTSINSNLPPPNAPATVAAKGSDKTLIDTGQMLNSVEWEIRSGKGGVGGKK